MKNCIVFDDRDDLVAKLKLAMGMDREQITTMRKNAIEYFENYLNPETFVNRVEARKGSKVTILLIAESNMARRHTKLNRFSILMRGTVRENKRSLLGHMRQRLLPQR